MLNICCVLYAVLSLTHSRMGPVDPVSYFYVRTYILKVILPTYSKWEVRSTIFTRVTLMCRMDDFAVTMVALIHSFKQTVML